MKYIIGIILIVFFWSCNEDEEPNNYTGNQVIYELVQSSTFPVSGTATFVERRDGMVELIIKLVGTEGNIQHPAHLHYGDISTPDAIVARLLNPVDGETGESVTLFDQLVDESVISYQELLTFEGHIKVHLDGDANKSIILASGNIGSAVTKIGTNGRQRIAICRSK